MYLQRFFVEGLAHASYTGDEPIALVVGPDELAFACTVCDSPGDTAIVNPDARSPRHVNGN